MSVKFFQSFAKLIDRTAKFLSIEEKTMRILDFRPIYGKRIERPIRSRRRGLRGRREVFKKATL
jgi:hypothetical protein